VNNAVKKVVVEAIENALSWLKIALLFRALVALVERYEMGFL
jgi:hypothetical protein